MNNTSNDRQLPQLLCENKSTIFLVRKSRAISDNLHNESDEVREIQVVCRKDSCPSCGRDRRLVRETQAVNMARHYQTNMPMLTLTLPQVSFDSDYKTKHPHFADCDPQTHVKQIHTKSRMNDFGFTFQFECGNCHKSVMRYLKLWRDCVKKRLPDFDYSLTKEPQKSGSIHLHLIICAGSQDFARADYEYLKRTWCRITGAGVWGQNVKESPLLKETMKELKNLSKAEKKEALLQLRSSEAFQDSIVRSVRYQTKYLKKSFDSRIPKYARRSTRTHNWGLGVSYASERKRLIELWLQRKGVTLDDSNRLNATNGWQSFYWPEKVTSAAIRPIFLSGRFPRQVLEYLLTTKEAVA